MNYQGIDFTCRCVVAIIAKEIYRFEVCLLILKEKISGKGLRSFSSTIQAEINKYIFPAEFVAFDER